MCNKKYDNKKKICNKRFVINLMDWHKNNRRKFGWRDTDEAYKILISEILLQRTRAEKVNEIYDKFFKKFPDVISLSEATEKEISELIAPLGLKKRVPYLIELSKIIRERRDSDIPKNFDELLNLKGVGFYTANAVMCFAYGKNSAIVDWNVARVIKRIWDVDISNSPHTNEKVLSFAQNLMPRKNPKDYNWALLDFAALVCKPQRPDCSSCPLQNFCIYYRNESAALNKTL